MTTTKWHLTCANARSRLWMKKNIDVIPFTFRTHGCHEGSPLAHPGIAAAPTAYPQPTPSYPPIEAAHS